MDESTTASGSVPPSGALNSLLSNPELLRNLGSLLGNKGDAGGQSEENADGTEHDSGQGEATAFSTDGLSKVLSDPGMMAMLPQVMAMLRPMMEASQDSQNDEKAPPQTNEAGAADGAIPVSAPSFSRGKRSRTDCRDELLIALKPFLSKERCEAVDTIIRLAKLGNVLKQLK